MLESCKINKVKCSFYAHSGWVVIYGLLLWSWKCGGLLLLWDGQRSIPTARRGSSSPTSYGGVFRTYWGFVRDYFASSLSILITILVSIFSINRITLINQLIIPVIFKFLKISATPPCICCSALIYKYEYIYNFDQHQPIYQIHWENNFDYYYLQ